MARWLGLWGCGHELGNTHSVRASLLSIQDQIAVCLNSLKSFSSLFVCTGFYEHSREQGPKGGYQGLPPQKRSSQTASDRASSHREVPAVYCPNPSCTCLIAPWSSCLITAIE